MDIDRMDADEIYQRLAAIATELERLNASVWLLEHEREIARARLRKLNAIPQQVPA